MVFSDPATVRAFIRTYARGDNWHNIDIRTANLGYGWIHYGLIRTLRPERILVIGSKYGYIPAVCAAACKDNGRGMVDFVDAGYDATSMQGDDHWGGAGYWRTKAGRAAFKRFRLENHIRLHVMTTSEFHNQTANATWGYIYLDGDHSYGGARSDYSLFFPDLMPGGYLTLHDILTVGENGERYGVSRLWQELKHEHRNLTIEIPGDCGLGILRRPDQSGNNTARASLTRTSQLFSRAIRRLFRT